MTVFNKNDILNLSTGMVSCYTNDLLPKENLITTYILYKVGASQIHNEELRKELSETIIVGKHTLGLGDFTTLKENYDD